MIIYRPLRSDVGVYEIPNVRRSFLYNSHVCRCANLTTVMARFENNKNILTNVLSPRGSMLIL